MELRPTPYDATEAAALVEALFHDLNERYGDEDDEGEGWKGEVTPPAVAAPDGEFLVAYLDGVPVGCGGIKRWSATTAEVKRMYTAPAGRRRGVGRALLRGLEDAARRLGYEAVRLETGEEQPEAMRLYEAEGYERIPPYGRYRDDPRSACFQKRL